MPFDPSDFGSPRFDLEGDVVVINEPPGSYAPAFSRRGANTRGKQRTTIEIRSEPLLMDLDALALGAGPAEAIRDKLSRDTKNITEVASPATLARRRSAADNPSAPWVQRKYGGGRTGFKAPNQTVRLFNDSGRLADGFFVRDNKEDGSYTVNVPANRFDPSTFDGAGFERMLERFRSLMPVLQDSREILADPAFNKAVSDGVAAIAQKGEMGDSLVSVSRLRAVAAAKRRARMAVLSAARQLIGL